MKITKEEIITTLQGELATAKAELKISKDKDLAIRTEISKAFGFYKPLKQYAFDRDDLEVRVVSWELIFVEIGKLLAAKNFLDFEGNISELQTQVEQLHRLYSEDKKEKSY